jgi:hypothetical protein
MSDSTKSKPTQSRRTRRRQAPDATWDDVEPAIIHRAIIAISGRSGALRFGLTRDGSSFALGVYEDGESETIYSHDAMWIQQTLLDITEGVASPTTFEPIEEPRPTRPTARATQTIVKDA